MFNQFLEDLENEKAREIPMGRGIIAEMEAAREAAKQEPDDLEKWRQMVADIAQAPAPDMQEPTSGFTPDISKPQRKEVQLTRAEKRIIKRGGGPLPGNNRPNHKGRAIVQEAAMGLMKVGEEPRLVTVATMVRGKGGKKKVVLRRTLLSREIIATDEKVRSRVMGTIAPDENDSVKNAEIYVVGVRNGRLKNS